MNEDVSLPSSIINLNNSDITQHPQKRTQKLKNFSLLKETPKSLFGVISFDTDLNKSNIGQDEVKFL